MAELQAHDQPVLPDPGEPVGVLRLDLAQSAGEGRRDVVHHRPDLGPAGDLERLQRRHAAEFGAAERGHVGEAVLGQPARGGLAGQHHADRVHAAGDALAGHQDVRVDAVLADGPQLAGAHQPGLHLVGDVQRAVALAQFFHSGQVAGRGQREAVGGRDRLHDHGGHVPAAQRSLHRLQVVERHVAELVRPVGQEQGGEPLVAGGHGEPGVPVVGLGHRDDAALLRRVPRAFQRDVDGLPAAGPVHDFCQPWRCAAQQGLGQGGAGQAREVMVADVEALHGRGHRGRHLGVAVAQVVGAAVEVDVDEPLALDVVDEVALPAVDDQRNPGVDPELGLVRVPELLGFRQHVLLRGE